MSTEHDSNTTAEIVVQDLHDEISGKVILLTGASPGSLGTFFAEHVAKASPKLLILAGRTTSKLQATADVVVHANSGVEIRILHLDPESLTQARTAAGFDCKSPGRGVAKHVFAAFEPSLRAHSEAYLTDSHIADPCVDTTKPHAVDRVEADRLWQLSEELNGETFTY